MLPATSPSRMNTPLAITDGATRLTVDPRIGGSFLNFAAHCNGEWLDIMRSTPEGFKTSSDTASFLMAPYPNRIRNGSFQFEGRRYDLKFPEKHSIHGDVRNRPWRVEVARPAEAILQFRSRDFSDINYPFAFSVTQSFRISKGALLVECSIKNEDDVPFPAGCGYHPYFMRALGNHAENVQLRFLTQGAYPYTGETPLPEGMSIPLTPAQNFSTPRDLNVSLDSCFAGWNGEAEMVWPESKVRAVMHASSNMSHLVLFSPPGKPFFALEPQSMMTDGFNFLARGEQDTGTAILAPGESLSSWFSLTIERLPL
jgi:aldose 1-epimerase